MPVHVSAFLVAPNLSKPHGRNAKGRTKPKTRTYRRNDMHMHSVLREEILFQHLEERDMDLVVDAMLLKTFDDGDVVIRQ